MPKCPALALGVWWSQVQILPSRPISYIFQYLKGRHSPAFFVSTGLRIRTFLLNRAFLCSARLENQSLR